MVRRRNNKEIGKKISLRLKARKQAEKFAEERYKEKLIKFLIRRYPSESFEIKVKFKTLPEEEKKWLELDIARLIRYGFP